MRKYNVGLEIHGKQVKVGTIEGESFESAQFAYSDEYISGADAYLRGSGTALTSFRLNAAVLSSVCALLSLNVLANR